MYKIHVLQKSLQRETLLPKYEYKLLTNTNRRSKKGKQIHRENNF